MNNNNVYVGIAIRKTNDGKNMYVRRQDFPAVAATYPKRFAARLFAKRLGHTENGLYNHVNSSTLANGAVVYTLSNKFRTR